jgi:hypothetical protein
MKLTKYFLIGLKLSLVLLLSSLILLIPMIISSVILLFQNYLLYLILWIIFGTIGLTLNGWLIIKYRKWIFKGVR